MKIIGIMACTNSGVIGKNNRIPWSYPDEFKHFRTVIGKNPIIMGRKTFLSVPRSILNNREVIVFSKDKYLSLEKNVCAVSSLDEFSSLDLRSQTAYMIGGGNLAKCFIQNNLISEFILTIVNKEYEGDSFFPLELLKNWDRSVVAIAENYVIYNYLRPSKI